MEVQTHQLVICQSMILMNVQLASIIVLIYAPTLMVVSIVLVIKVTRYWLIKARVKVRLIMIGSLI